MPDNLFAPGFSMSGPPTPNKIASQLSELDLPEPTGFSFPSQNAKKSPLPAVGAPAGHQGHVRRQSNADDVAKELSKMRLPDPERIGQSVANRRRESLSEQLSSKLAEMDFPTPERIQQVDRKRRESQSEQLSAELAGMDFPQPERIFGGAGEAKGGVSADAWDNVKLDTEYDVPEAVRRGSTAGISMPPAPSDQKAQPVRGHRKGQPSLSSVNEEAISAKA
jgi:hypothetical protein